MNLALEINPSTSASRLKRWRFMVLALATLSVLSVTPPSITIYLIYGVTLGLLVMGFRRPALLVAAIILVEITIGSYPSTTLGVGITAQYAVVLLSICIILVRGPLTTKWFDLGPGAVRVVLPAAAFLCIAILATSEGFTPELTVEAVRHYGIPFATMLIIPLVIKNGEDMRLVGKITIGALVLSAAAAVLQHLNYMGIPAPAIIGSGLRGGRSLGLNSSPVDVANHLLIGFLMLWGLLAAYTLERREGRLIIFLLLVTALGWFFTYTRSSLYAAVIGMAITVPFLRGRVRKEVILVSLALLPVIFFVLLKDNNRYSAPISRDNSAASRLVLWQVGIDIAKDYPALGVGYRAYGLVAPRYLDKVVLTDDIRELGGDFQGESTLAQRYPVHNDFLRVWLSFGVPALLVYVIFIAGIAITSLKAYFRAADPWMMGAALGLFSALAGYTANSMLHNALDSTTTLWILAGLSMVMLRISSAKSEGNPAPQ